MAGTASRALLDIYVLFLPPTAATSCLNQKNKTRGLTIWLTNGHAVSVFVIFAQFFDDNQNQPQK